MTPVFIYKRVSSDEQALGFSLNNQDGILTDHCKRNSLFIAGVYSDDFSGKTFDRPGFNRMMQDAKAKKPKQILFVNWSRFSRATLADTYTTIDKIRSLGIEVQAVQEPVNLEIPQSWLMLAIYIANPHVENLIRRENSMRGTRQANKEGRYTGQAPAGYKNQRDDKGKPVIIPDEKAPMIKTAFDLIAEGKSQSDARMEMWRSGWKVSRSRFFSILHNQTYIGNVVIPEYKNEPVKVIRGIHTPIVEETTFYKVQDILNGNKRNSPRKHRKVIEELPLRGFLYCDHDHKMTGSCSKGHGGLYHYYHCPNELACQRHRATQVNDGFVSLLGSIKVKKSRVELLQMLFEQKIKAPASIGQIETKIDAQQKSIDLLVDRYVQAQISSDDYTRTRARYESVLFDLKQQLEVVSVKEGEFAYYLAESLKLIGNLSEFYLNASPEIKPKLIGSIIAGRVYFKENECRTSEFTPLVSVLTASVASFSLDKKMRTSDISPLVLSGSPSDTLSRTFSIISGAKELSNLLKLVA